MEVINISKWFYRQVLYFSLLMPIGIIFLINFSTPITSLLYFLFIYISVAFFSILPLFFYSIKKIDVSESSIVIQEKRKNPWFLFGKNNLLEFTIPFSKITNIYLKRNIVDNLFKTTSIYIYHHKILRPTNYPLGPGFNAPIIMTNYLTILRSTEQSEAEKLVDLLNKKVEQNEKEIPTIEDLKNETRYKWLEKFAIITISIFLLILVMNMIAMNIVIHLSK